MLAPRAFNEEMVNKRKIIVRYIIINHLDENSHKRILQIKDPRAILQKLMEYTRIESNVTHSSVRTKLFHLKLKPKEKFAKFIRYDAIIKECESCIGAVPLSDEKKKVCLLSGSIREITKSQIS